jgi:alpha-1,2-mannosyltransferase
MARGAVARMMLVMALLWHAIGVADHYREATRSRGGLDFASYYYAVQVAAEGGDPYDKAELANAAQDDDTRKGVHPFFYPPPFLLTMVWALPLDLHAAYRLWFWIDELFALASAFALWRWWRGLGDAATATLIASGALLTAVPNNHLMGQANFPVLFAVITGLWAAERGRDVLGGALVGAACMMKMSPALFVVWWLLHGRWRAAAVACGSAVVYSLATLPLLGLSDQVSFYAEVLPEFSSGSYNGLGVGIDLFGNHSLPNLYDAWFPNGGGGHLVLSGVARVLSSGTLLVLSAFTFWALRRSPGDALSRAAHVGAIAAVMLLVPVITYEHHLIWLMPGAVAAVAALAGGRLSPRWGAPLGLALTAWCFDLVDIKSLSLGLAEASPLAAWVVRELKMMAILVVYAACLRVGRERA